MLQSATDHLPVALESGRDEHVGVPAPGDDAGDLTIWMRSDSGEVIVDNARTTGVAKPQPLRGSDLSHAQVALFAVAVEAKSPPAM